MDKLKHPSFKPLEVIWNRNTSTHKPKLLPELKGINIEDSVEKVKKSAKSPDVKTNENKIEHIHKRVKRSLFQEDKIGKVYKHSDSEELNKKLCKTFDYANCLRKRPYSIYKTSQLKSPTKSHQIVSNRKSTIINQDASLNKSKKQCLFPTKIAKTEISSSHTVNDSSVIKPSCTKDQLNSRTKFVGCSKSPEIMSNRKRYVISNNLDETDVSSYERLNMNYKTCIPIDQVPENINVNTQISKMESKLNYVHSEDIIESSEKISLPVKKKKKKKKNRILNKKNKIKNFDNSKVPECKTFTNGKNEMNLRTNEIRKSTEISTTVKTAFCDEINFDSLDIINTENILVSPITELKTESYCREPKKSIIQEHQNRGLARLCIINDDNQRYSDTSLTHSSLNTKEFVKNTVKEYSKIIKHHKEKLFNQNEDNIMSFMHSSEISVIPATPEHEAVNVDNSIIQYSPETILSPYVPLIEVDQSPKTPHGRNSQVLIQSVQTPPNVDGTTLPGLFEPIASPTQSFINYELPFKIDSVESPRAIHENNDIIFSPEINRKKSDTSPLSPNRFDSAKKRKKMSKDGLRGKFRDLINRKKSEARIREYEKSLSKSYKPKQGETAVLKVIEAWKEFRMIVLLCYYMKSDKEVQRVLVTLDNCPLNAAKNSIIRIYSPWLTIKSDITEVLLFIGIIHAEVIEFSESITRPLDLVEGNTDLNALQATVFQNKVLWKCNCSKDAACQCLGELSVYNYLQYMIPH
ncbi:uncharacterized protein LOC100572499 [Acyrthosiphon pisum]|uniref:Uncharacterized protein n=1 Tax=Acyrthosiphon pisum TaxID=7029 RepID=A0A8R2H7M0_ACYPI|nr:uncharacterized protein LOC100572499 [Acyrthosiphon pisum]XP_016662622.1 uncharacterized protein LOC100572499 [Acyrthosiphon pisum]|eukprot:XP_008186355.1 PREDICTED: uncharacterized protein LOC100572499 [Acyrthosiphon pisum]